MAQSITLVLITRDVLARIDLRGSRQAKPTGVWSSPRIDSDDLATLIDVALRQGPGRRHGVWVLSTDFWTGSIEVARELISQVQGDKLGQTLAFEAETYSGIAPFDSEIEFRQMPGTALPTYWVTQIPLQAREVADQVVRAWGGKLLGIGHPASTHPPAQDDGQPWARVECWDDVVLAAAQTGRDARRVLILGGDARAESTRRQLEPWLEQLDTAPSAGRPNTRFQWWHARHGDARTIPAGWTEHSRDEQIDLQLWAVDWWNSRAEAMRPLFAPLKRTLSPTTTALIGAGLAALAALGCYAHYQFLMGQKAELETEVKELVDRKKMLDDRNKVVTELTATLKKNESLAALLETDIRWASRVGMLQAKMHQHLLDGISATCPAEVILTRIEPQTETTLLSGYALGDRECDEFVERLENWLAPYGWQVEPATVERDGDKHPSLFKFEILLREQNEGWFSREVAPTPNTATPSPGLPATSVRESSESVLVNESSERSNLNSDLSALAVTEQATGSR